MAFYNFLLFFCCIMECALLASNPFAVFSQKPIQKEQHSFSTIAYKKILEQCKQYHFKWVAVNADVVELNKLLYALHYLDLGAVQVFRTQQRTADFKTVQQLSCTIKKNKYSHWFLDLKSFFAQYAKRLAVVKNAFIAIQHGTDLFEKVPYAQTHVLALLKNQIESIDKELETQKEQQKQDKQKSVTEVVEAQEQKIKELNSEIEKDQQTINQLQQQIKKIEQDTLDWQHDLALVQKQKNTSEQLGTQAKEQEDSIQNELKTISKEKALLNSQMKDLENKIQLLQQSTSLIPQINDIIQKINAYNTKKQQEINNRFGFSLNLLESNELKKEREAVYTQLNQLPIESIKLIDRIDNQNLFTQELIDLLQEYQETSSISEKTDTLQTSLGELNKQKKALFDRETTLEQEQRNSITKFSEQLATAAQEQAFIHNNVLWRNSNETERIQNEMNMNSQKIAVLQQSIKLLNIQINEKQENLLLLQNSIKTVNQELPKLLENVESLLQAQKSERLKTLPYADYGQQYINTMLPKKAQPSIVKDSALLNIAQTIDTILYNLELIYAVPPLKKEVSIPSLTGGYVETLSMLDTLKYKAADVQQQAIDRFAAFKKAFAQVTSKQQSTTPVQKEKIDTQKENRYCAFDNSLVENIQAKTVALKEDVQAMLNHTLTLAQSVQNDYKKVIVIKDLLFVPLCKAYEKLELITNPWLNGHDQSHNEPFELKALTIAYSALLQSEQQLSAMIDNKETLIIAEYFFMQVGKDLLQSIEDSKINATEKNNDQWFEHTFNTIRAYEFALKHIQSTQVRWYSFSKESKKRLLDLFGQLKRAVLNKKIELAMALLPTIEQLQEHAQEKIHDLFINNEKNIDGRLIDSIDGIMKTEQAFIRLAHLFPSKSTLKNTITSSLKNNIQAIIDQMIVQKTKLGNTLFDQVTKPLYEAVIAQGKQLLLVLPDDVAPNKKISTNPFD